MEKYYIIHSIRSLYYMHSTYEKNITIIIDTF